MKTKMIIESSLAAIAGLLMLTACNQPPDSASQQPSQADRASEQLLQRCISQARSSGYYSGQCAYRFLNACVNTQSRNEMEAVLRADNALGMTGSKLCPNSPDTYSAVFDKF